MGERSVAGPPASATPQQSSATGCDILAFRANDHRAGFHRWPQGCPV